MEEQLLPLAELEPAYEKAVWLYVFRDFSGDARDRHDERVALRFGFSSYPQHKLVHPETFAILDDTGRSVESFLAAVGRTRVEVSDTHDAAAALRAAEERAQRLEERPGVKAAEAALDDDDVVVRLRALEILAAEKPEAIVARAPRLLAVENDGVRYAACRALAAAGGTSAARPLEALLATPGATLNPNVLRMHAVQALARCGDAASVEALAPFADRAEWRNALTRAVVTALVEIAGRERGTRDRVRELLVGTLPDPQEDERMQRIAVALARHVHDALGTLTGRRVDFPGTYDAEGLAALRRAWERAR